MSGCAICPTGTDAGTRRGTVRRTDAVRCWVQIQNQIQNQISSYGWSVVLSGSDQIQVTVTYGRRLGIGGKR